MEHFDLEVMFGRRQKPDVNLTAKPMEGLGDERERVTFLFNNEGRALAKYVGFSARFDNATITHVEGLQNDTRLNDGRATVSFNNNDVVVHPVGVHRNVGWAAFMRLEKDKPVTFMSFGIARTVIARSRFRSTTADRSAFLSPTQPSLAQLSLP